MGATFKYSALGMRTLAQALRSTRIYEPVVAEVRKETREVLESPFAQPWADGAVLADVAETVSRLHGKDRVAELFYVQCKESLGMLMLPVVKVSLALGKNEPAAVFHRADEMFKVTLQNVSCVYEPRGATGGVARFKYGEVVAPALTHSWVGTLRFLCEAIGVKGSATAAVPENGGCTAVVNVVWTQV